MKILKYDRQSTVINKPHLLAYLLWTAMGLYLQDLTALNARQRSIVHRLLNGLCF